MQNGLTVHRVRDRSGLRLFGGNVSAGNGCLDRDVGAIGIALKFEQLRRTVRGIAELRPPDDQIDRCAKPAFARHGQPGCIGLHGDVLAADRSPADEGGVCRARRWFLLGIGQRRGEQQKRART